MNAFSENLANCADTATRYAILRNFWHDFHKCLAANLPPDRIIDGILELTGKSFGADRAYVFSVADSRASTSCTNEWVCRADLALKPFLHHVDQRGLKGWLDRFNANTSICIEDVDNPPEDLCQPARKFKGDRIRSIYVFGCYDGGRLAGYLGVDYVFATQTLDEFAKEILSQVASTLNLFILRHESLEVWSRTAEELPSALFIKDADNDLRYRYANPKYLSFFGQDIIGKTDFEAFGAEIGETFRRQDEECLASGRPFLHDGPQQSYAKKVIGFYSLVKFPVTTKTGRRFIAGFITNISAEHELRVQATDLLQKSKAAEKAKSLFLAAMSHEIRTPLNVIIGLVDELRHADIPEETRADYLASVSSASRALLALINDVLDVSKIEAGQMHLTPVETDLLIVLGECESIFAETCRGKGLKYLTEVSENLPVVLVDTSRIRQILLNLIGNAAKFTPAGEIRVAGIFHRETDKVGTLTLEVADTGIGISEEDQKNVFGLFEQASRTRGTCVANKGTGLGLCLCKRLAECMNGEISLTSELDKGSTFTVVFHNVPYVERNKASDVIRHRKDRTIRINPVSIKTRVLVVDDVALNLKVLGIILRRMNVDAVLAGSAAEALDLLAKPRNGVTHVLTDIWMPEINGEELARRIRANPAWRKLRIAAQTADVEASDNFDASLFDTILSKPLTPEKVMAFLGK